jgi:hypothetical protein
MSRPAISASSRANDSSGAARSSLNTSCGDDPEHEQRLYAEFEADLCRLFIEMGAARSCEQRPFVCHFFSKHWPDCPALPSAGKL